MHVSGWHQDGIPVRSISRFETLVAGSSGAYSARAKQLTTVSRTMMDSKSLCETATIAARCHTGSSPDAGEAAPSSYSWPGLCNAHNCSSRRLSRACSARSPSSAHRHVAAVSAAASALAVSCRETICRKTHASTAAGGLGNEAKAQGNLKAGLLSVQCRPVQLRLANKQQLL